MKALKKMLSVGLSLVMCTSMVAPALAAEYDIRYGNVNVSSSGSTGWDSSGNVASGAAGEAITIRGSTNQYGITVENNTTADITLDVVNINSDINSGKAAMSIGEGSNVTVHLQGANTLEGHGQAGIQLNGGNVTITTDEGAEGASLTANGHDGAAGIGGGNGNITIKNSNVIAQGTSGPTQGGAAIGGGTGHVTGNITITNSNVKAVAGAVGSGIGAGSGGMTGNITITSSDVFSEAGWSANGVGLGGNNGNIEITGGNVTGQAGKNGIAVEGSESTITITGATVKAYATVRGDGIKGTKDIIIDSSNVTADSKAGGAAIGSVYGMTGKVEIKNGSTVKATSNEVAIGGGGYAKFAGDIIIDGSEVTAVSKGEAAIGAGGPGMSGNITIANGAVVTAVGGNYPSAIGRDGDAMEGVISVSENSTVLALNKGTNPAVVDNTGSANVLNGQFDNGYFDKTVKAGKTEFTIVNKDGETLATFDVKAVVDIPKDGKWSSEEYTETFQSFGLVWPEGAFAIKDADGNYLCYQNGDDKMVAFEASQLTNQGSLKVMESQVKYSFAEGDTPEGYTDAKAAYDDGTKRVDASDGIWALTWDGKAPETTQVVVGGKLVDVDIVGAWSFAANTVVKYEPKSDSAEKELPDNLPSNPEKDQVVTVEGGKWTFQGWKEDEAFEGCVDYDNNVFTGEAESPVYKDGELLEEIIVEGIWVFEADPEPVPEPDPVVVDTDVIDRNAPENTSTATMIEDEAVPLAGLFTRADAIGYLWEQSGSPEWELSDFADVPEDHQWAVAIGWAQAMGIALADEDGNFRPDDLVLRSTEDIEGEFQEFLNRYAVYAGVKLDAGELFIELEGEPDDVIMGEDAQVIFDDFFARLEEALAGIAA